MAHARRPYDRGRNNNFMIVNATATPGVIFQEDVTLVSGKNYEFSVHAANLLTVPGLAPNLSFETQDGFGVVPHLSGELGQTNPFAWQQQAFLFNSGSLHHDFSRPQQPIRHFGNDLAVDDFKILECINLPAGGRRDGRGLRRFGHEQFQNGGEPGIPQIEVRLIND